ncbi:MYG1 family protein [Candidatus Nomurabacteria bacterium]|nr:MYG1 family protein [Candidatus Nomurabacteria bacterium]MCB9819419.1 MYG1 family protein [Candidatus Nomurabacteria bacterium]
MQKIITHSGSFHSDDIFAVATLQLHFGVENVEVIRTRDEEIIASGDIVVDVGGVYDAEKQRFDHHQNGAPVRDNGIPYAAFGLIWKHYGEQVAGSPEAAADIERRFVLPIDANDVGISLYDLNDKNIAPITLQDLMSLWRPVWGSIADDDIGFTEACAFARDTILRAILQTKGDIAQKQYVESIYTEAINKQVLIFDKSVSTFHLIDYPEVFVAVYPSEEGDRWSAAMVRKSHDSFETRVKFPAEWGGLRDEELAKVSDVSDAVFCHKAGFLFVARSKEGALEAARKAIG